MFRIEDLAEAIRQLLSSCRAIEADRLVILGLTASPLLYDSTEYLPA